MYDQSFINNTDYRKVFGEMDDVTRKEADSLYKKIINEVASGLKHYGFRKSRSTRLERNNEYMIQILSFQRYTHLPAMTINTSIRPLFMNTMDDGILPLCKRFNRFETGESSWYPIKRDTKSVSDELLSILIEKVLPYFEVLDTPEKIVENRELIENSEYTSPASVILPCALRIGDNEISLLYLDKEINRINTQIWAGADLSEYGRYLEYFTYLKSLVTGGKWQEIYSLLKSYEKEFIKNKYGDRL